jgi:hypothetical protein
MSIQKNYSRKKMPQMARTGKNGYGDPKPKIKCQKCKEYLRQNRFSLIDKNNNEGGRRSICQSCSAKKAKIEREKRKNNWKYKPSLAMLNNSKQRAKRANIEHNILLEDIVIPEYCPVLGIKLETGDRKSHYNAPSIDRIDNSKGYTKDNIFIMSTKANLLKKDATLEELILIGKWANEMKGKTH